MKMKINAVMVQIPFETGCEVTFFANGTHTKYLLLSLAGYRSEFVAYLNVHRSEIEALLGLPFDWA